VGVDQQQLRDLTNQYLYDDPYYSSWQDPQRSFFDEARMRSTGTLTLVEHHRCVPELIEFSNRIAYEPDGVRLVPVRQFGAGRLDPIKAVSLRTATNAGLLTRSIRLKPTRSSSRSRNAASTPATTGSPLASSRCSAPHKRS
jgi:hypothetical protein